MRGIVRCTGRHFFARLPAYGTLHHKALLVFAFPVQHFTGAPDFRNLVANFLYFKRTHFLVIVAQLLFQAQNFGILARQFGSGRPCRSRIPGDSPLTGSGLHIRSETARTVGSPGFHERIVVSTRRRNRVGRFHPVLAGTERLELATMPELVAIGFVENGIVVHEGDSLALGLRSTLAGIVVIFGFAVFRLAFRGLLAEQSHKPAHPLGNKRKMPGPKPERKH